MYKARFLIFLTFFIFLFGCTNPNIPPEWDLPREPSYNGDFNNINSGGEENIIFRVTLSTIIWPKSKMDADFVRLSHEAERIQVEAFKNGSIIRSEVFILTNDTLILSKNRAEQGALSQTIIRFIRNQKGLVVEIIDRGISVSLPFVGGIKLWYFYPVMK